MSNDPLCSIFSVVYLVTLDDTRSLWGFPQTYPLWFRLLRRWLFVISVIDIWMFGHGRLLRVDVSVRLWRWGCGSIVNVTPFALPYFALRPLMVVFNHFFLAFNGVSFSAFTSTRVVRRCGSLLTDRYCIQDDVLVDGQRIFLYANTAIWSVSLYHRLVVCRSIRRFRAVRTLCKWCRIDDYLLLCFEDRFFASAAVIIVLISLLHGSQSLFNVFSHKCQPQQQAATQYVRRYIAE